MIDFKVTSKPNVRRSINKSIKSLLKWHGGKQKLADWIISLMPSRALNPNAPSPDDLGWLHFVEPFFGGGSVLFELDSQGISEVVNDLNEDVTNFFDVVRSSEAFPRLQAFLFRTPFSQLEFERSLTSHSKDDPISRAAYFFIRNRQSRQGLGRDFATLSRNRTRSGANEQVSAWCSAIEELPKFHERLKKAVILNLDACKVIRQQDGPRTLFYLDPTYLAGTRSSGGEYGEFEMTEDDHRRLLETLSSIEGRFLLSGYPSSLYEEFAAKNGWTLHTKDVALSSSSKKKKDRRVECVWTNY